MSMPKAITSAIIAGGDNNELYANSSAILGGDNNTINGFNCAGIYGFGITAVAHCAFHVHNFVVHGMPPTNPFLPGHLFTNPGGGFGNAVFVS